MSKRRPPSSSLKPQASSLFASLKPLRSAFTLTELLIVIAIIAMLAALITAAAVNAMRNANRASITLEIKNLSGALENLKSEFGSYPPNGMNPAPSSNPLSGSAAALVQADFQRMFKKAFQRHQEPPTLIAALCGQYLSGPPANGNLPNGLTAAEALYFWLGGFSDDPLRPISGAGGPSFSDATGNNNGVLEAVDEVLESRNIRYEFDVARLGPRNDDGTYNDAASAGRFLVYEIDLNGDGDVADPGEERRINLWRYNPKGSEQPLVYFDVSRYKPHQYDVWAALPAPTGTAPYIFAMKEVRSGATGEPTTAAEYRNNIVYVEQGKFQILHAGLDDEWGPEFAQFSPHPSVGVNGWGSAKFGAIGGEQLMLYPTGPFIGEVADTLTSFTDGTLEDSVEE